MARLALEQLNDFSDYTDCQELREILRRNSLSDVRLSPDGRHIHVILRKPKVGLVTFDKYERPQSSPRQKELELRVKQPTPILDILYFAHNHGNGKDCVIAVVHVNGRAEFWKFEESITSWNFLHTTDLCNSPRATVMSVCVCSNLVIWCEERPPSDTFAPGNKNNFRFCICKREFEVDDGGVSFGGVKIILHNNPCFTMLSSGECVYLLPNMRENPQLDICCFFLCWSPRNNTMSVSSICKRRPLKKDSVSTKENDFKKLMTGCVAYLASCKPPQISCFSPTRRGLLLLLSTGSVYLLQSNGLIREVHKLTENYLLNSMIQVSMCIYQNMLSLIKGQTLWLIDINCGRELGKISLKRNSLLFVNKTEELMPLLLSEMGLFVVVHHESSTSIDPTANVMVSGSSSMNSTYPGNLLLEAVFEEACTYYQQRSLSSALLTVDALKKGGRFQAPISLASILQNHLCAGLMNREQSESEAGCSAGDVKLKCSLESELNTLVSLEEVKGNLLEANSEEVEFMCEFLIQQEISRILSTELDQATLLYLNSIVKTFPWQAWRAVQAVLQLHYNGEGSLSSGAPSEMWKTILCPHQTPTKATNQYAKGEAKQFSLNINTITNSNPKAVLSALPANLPVFELLCVLVYHFQPLWLPRFLDLAQKEQVSTGLNLSPASSSWSFSGVRGEEGGERSVPLYKRALFAVHSLAPDRDQNQDMEVDLLLVSGRPNAILQSMRILMGNQQWERVTQVAQRFCKQSPLLNREIFASLLCEVAQHRNLDQYLDLLWALCPEDITVTAILNLVLKNIPSPNVHSLSFHMSDITSSDTTPFADPIDSQLTIGLLKPLFRKVLQRETKPSRHYADILQSPTSPPSAPPRQHTQSPRTKRDSAQGDIDNVACLAEGNKLHDPYTLHPKSQDNTAC